MAEHRAADNVPQGEEKQKDRLLIVEDNAVERRILCKELEGGYCLHEAKNGEEALTELCAHAAQYAAVVLDLVMPIMDGWEALRQIETNPALRGTPVLVVTGKDDPETEKKCLDLGAWDFVSKPYDGGIICSRIQNMIARNRLAESEKARYLSQHDPLTGFYNRSRFLQAVEQLVREHPQEDLALIRLDLDQFRLFSSFFGKAEGDKLLRFVAEYLQKTCQNEAYAVYGRMDSDVFGACVPYEKEKLVGNINCLSGLLSDYNQAYHLEPSIGIYCITDRTLDAEAMFARATMAADQCRNKYMTYLAFYDESLTQELVSEQIMTNDAQQALEEEQFVVYLQPKYDLRNDRPCGAEALVRWDKPGRGILSPGAFVPVFERNGFITKLDFYMWEHTCALLKKWMDTGMEPMPVSVNISRANMYNPKLTEVLLELVKKYGIPPALLELELTESAYMDNPDLMRKTVGELRKKGFVILMDDFGSGYSSLNTLKDIDVDVLKIDMKFLPTGESNGKSERILASVIRMAAWLNLTVIVEGVETEKQKNFLEGIGCNYVQGYYYARPMPAAEYEALMRNTAEKKISAEEMARLDGDLVSLIWSARPQLSRKFQELDQPAGVIEFINDEIALLEINEAFAATFGDDARTQNTETHLKNCLSAEDTAELHEAFRRARKSRGFAECTYKRLEAQGQFRWVHIRLQYVQDVADGAVLFAALTDISSERTLENEFLKYSSIVQSADQARSKLLVVDDSELSRKLVNNVFQRKYEVLQAADGEAGLALLRKNAGTTAVVLLDLVMPVMDGRAFLERKNEDAAIADIPVIVVSSLSSHSDQADMEDLNVSDYVAKPFIPQVLERRVENAIHNACFVRRKRRRAAAGQ